MVSLRTKTLLGYTLAGIALSAGAFAAPNNLKINESSSAPVLTVRQEIAHFANHYGKPVILHGALNLNAPVSIVDNDAAGARTVRVYFVTPSKSSSITAGTAAAQLVGNRGNVALRLSHVSAAAAIKAVASADHAQVRFPDGVPTGTVTLKASTLPLRKAVSEVASLTKTHWSLGYLLESTNPSLPSLNRNQVDTYTAASGAGNPTAALPPVSGHEIAVGATPESPVSSWPTGPVIVNLPPIKPLPRDAKGNILPITVHFPVPKPAVKPPDLTPAQQQALANQNKSNPAAAAEYYNEFYNSANNPADYSQNSYQQEMSTFPSFSTTDDPNQGYQNLFGGNFGTVSTYAPNSGFSLVPDYGYPYGW
jgi:hypothetical protein